VPSFILSGAPVISNTYDQTPPSTGRLGYSEDTERKCGILASSSSGRHAGTASPISAMRTVRTACISRIGMVEHVRCEDLAMSKRRGRILLLEGTQNPSPTPGVCHGRGRESQQPRHEPSIIHLDVACCPRRLASVGLTGRSARALGGPKVFAEGIGS
jgi:hypothetical protein